MQEVIRASRGAALECKGWRQEAALRMLMNNLDPEVAERPQDLVVYGGAGKAARDWPSFHAIVRELRRLENDETLLVQSGKPVGVFRTHEEAPRVLIANSNLVGHWSNWEQFHALEKLGLIMYGQMTAGSWIYIGTQGILQGTYETFAAAARKHFGGTLAGKLVVTGGMGGMGGAQPLAATMNGAAFLCVEADPERIKRRLKTGYCDIMVTSLEEAVRILRNAVHQKQAVSVGLAGNCAEVLPEMVRRGIVPDLLTDQTSAHDPLNGYIPAGYSVADAAELRARDPGQYVERAMDSIAVHVRAMLDLQTPGRDRLRLRQQHPAHGGRPRGLRRLQDPRLRARVHPAHVRRGPRPVPLGGPLGRCRPTSRRPTRRCAACSPRAKPSRAGSRWRASGCASRASRRASAGSAMASARSLRWR